MNACLFFFSGVFLLTHSTHESTLITIRNL